MSSEMARSAAEQVIRWMEDSPKVFEGVRRILDGYEQTVEVARAAQTERDRLQQQCEALREEARHLHAELGRLQKERTDTAHWVTTMLQEAAARFPITPPPA
jgi:predicted TPR repeat methyltransferase